MRNDATFKQTVDRTTRRLVEMDQSARDGVPCDQLITECANDADLAALSDCLQLIERVRHYQPDCLADLQSDDASSSAWLDGEGTLPRQFGRFELRQQLGDGGFGLVFLAYDPRLEREIALKLPRLTTLVTDSTRQRFIREAKAAASLNHPNIATIHETGQVGAVCYIASTYCQGGSLADTLRHTGAVDPVDAATLVATLADAIHFAHSRGVLHRDLKPANILLSAKATAGPPSASCLRVADFGLARIMDDKENATRTGALLGTPAYMSPEQADSRLHAISTASDIYGLGTILYELMTGRPPFWGDSPLAILDAVRHHEPTAPRRIRSGTPRDLEAICLKCLEKSPERRYASASALAEDLKRSIAGETISARPSSTAERVLRWCRRNRALSIMSALVLLAILIGSITSTVLWRAAERNASRVETRSQQLAEAVENLNSAIEMLFVTVAESEELRGYDAEPLRRKLLDQAQQYYQLLAAQRPLDAGISSSYAQTLFRLGLVHKQLGDASQAETVIRDALGVLATLPNGIDRMLKEAEWKRRLAGVVDQLGRHEEARRMQKDALQLAERATEIASREDDAESRDGDVLQALLWSDIAAGEMVESDLAEAGKAAEVSIQLWRKIFEQRGYEYSERVVLGYANSLWVLGISEEETGQLADAEQHLSQAIEFLDEHACTRENADLMMLLGRARKKLGIAVAKQNRFEDARGQYRLAIDCFQELVSSHPRVPEYRMELCSTRYSLSVTEYLDGNLDRTLTLLKQNVDEYASLAAQHVDRRIEYLNRAGVAWNMLSTVHREQGNMTAAVDAIQQALECYRRVEADKPDWIFNQAVIAESESNLGILLVKQGNFTEAQQMAESARDRVRPIVAQQSDHDRALRALYGAYSLLAEIHLQQDRLELSAEANDAALAILPDADGWESILRRAELSAEHGKLEEAKESLERFIDNIARSEKHFLDAARCAAKWMVKSSGQSGTDPESFRLLGHRALERAADKSGLQRRSFQDRIEADQQLDTLRWGEESPPQ